MYVFDLLAKRAELSPEKIALIDATDGRELSYQQLNARANRAALFLRDQCGIQPGQRVALLAHTCPELFELLYACAKIGALLVPLNWRLAAPELLQILADCTPRVLVYDPAFAASAAELRQQSGLEQLLVLGAGSADQSYEAALRSASAQPVIMPPRSLDQPWHILYTAGTTGLPKGVLQTFGMVLFNTLNIGFAIELTARDTTLNLLPSFHTGGLNMYTNPTLHVGGTAILQRSFEPAQTLRLLSERATAFFGVPAVYLFMSQHADFEHTDLSRMRSWACGGAPMPLSLLETYARRGIHIRQGFGMTETGPTVFILDAQRALRKPGSVGKPQLYVQVRIVDRQGQDVAAGEPGELLIKGPGVTPGYWNRPDATQTAFEQGWLHSGDVARCDDEGDYYIVDRWKDMFISGGENVYPAEVENVLYSHPAISEVAVVGVADPRWGEVGRAFVVLKPGQALSEPELIAYCDGQLARYKIPKSVRFLERLPRNAAGKVLKNELRGLA